MTQKGVYNKDDNQPGTVPSSSTASLSTKQIGEEVRNALTHLKTKGIKDWEILATWSEIAQEQGNYATADTLASAAYELGKQA
jgi:hypothetical protein